MKESTWHQAIRLLCGLVIWLLGLCPSNADPTSAKSGGTLYLKDAESFIGQAPVIPKITGTPAPTPSATPKATAQPTPFSRVDADDESKPVRDYPPAIIHRSSMNVGQQIPVPTRYAAPQVTEGQNGAVTVVPAMPTSFQTIQTGVTTGTDASGNTTVRDTELSGVVNYGQPIQRVVPVYNKEGQQIGTQVITVSSNPMLVPVIQTIEVQQNSR